MADVWIYLDESGTVDFDPERSGSAFFAFGCAVFRRGHGSLMSAFLEARASRSGLENGFHAYNDSTATRDACFQVIGALDVEFAATFMFKANAHSYVRARPRIWLYKYSLFVHLKAAVRRFSQPGDLVHVVAAHISMGAKQAAVFHAVSDVCRQMADDRVVIPHIWKSPTSAGLQIADYGLWAIQRVVVQEKASHHYEHTVRPREAFCHFPWSRGAPS